MKNKNIEEVTELDSEEIAKQVAYGYKSGILDGEGYRISWKLEMDKFEI